MPSSDKHLLGFFVLFAVAVFLFYALELGDDMDSANLAIVVVSGAVFSIAPDIDIGNSKSRKWLNRILAVGILVLLYLYWGKKEDIYLWGVGGIGGSFLLLSMTKHGRLLHNYLVWLVVSLLVGYFSFFFGLGILFGSWSHLVLDDFLIQ